MKKRVRALLAACSSAGLHLFVVVPLGIARLLVDTAPQWEVTYLPAQEDAPEEGAAAQWPPEPLRLAEGKLHPVERFQEPPPDPVLRRPEEPAPPETPQPPPLVVLPDAHLKMVDQDQFPDEADNPDAKYLAQKNHRAQEEMRAENRNLLRNQTGERASSEGAQRGPQPGEDERKVAELQQREADPRRAPISPEEGAAERLAERRAPPTQHEVPEAQREVARDGLRMPDEQGLLPLAQGDARERQPAAPRTGARADLRLHHDDYERIVGHDRAAQERQAGREQRSKTPGRWDRLQQKLALMRSSLENFTPTLRTGHESELGTRRHPFAAYIARMHRQIHRFWGFGYLVELDGKPPNAPLNDMSLWTGLEITLRPDGTIEKLVIEHPSGHSAFDAAAMDAVISSGPFEAPPEAIKSRDGKVYISWRFHRDNRQCATDFVQPHILLTPPRAKDSTGASAPPQRTEPQLSPEGFLQRPLLSLAPLREPKEPDATLPLTARAAGGRGAPVEVPGEARQVAEKWLAAYTRGDARWLAGYSAVPFSAGGRTVAEDGESLRAMYRQLISERDDRRGTLTFYTPAQLRQQRGRLPAGGDEDDMMFALLKSGHDDIVLLLQPADRGWRVVGIDR